MDIKKILASVRQAVQDKKLTKPVFVLGICGIVLIYLSSLLPSGEGASRQETPVQLQENWSAEEYQHRLEEDLSRIVTAVTGESSPQVMVTLENGGRSLYAADSKGEEERAHVVLENKDGDQRGLELSREQPKVQGAVIVSRAAGDPAIREKLVNAARTALGIPSSRVCVVDGQ